MTDPRQHRPGSDTSQNATGRVGVPIIDLTRGIDGPRDRQLLFGDAVMILERQGDYSRVCAAKDGYCGTLPQAAIATPAEPTHKVTARATHAYDQPDIKSPDRATLSFGASLTALSETPTFIETDIGFVPRQHLHPADTIASDPAAVAEIFLGTPYLWGGNSFLGIDCSGLVQAACLACGIACPGDSHQQAGELGQEIKDDTKLQRNDLIFWPGHVALVYDTETLIHANAGHMAVVLEPIQAALTRIANQGDGLPTLRKRLSVL